MLKCVLHATLPSSCLRMAPLVTAQNPILCQNLCVYAPLDTTKSSRQMIKDKTIQPASNVLLIIARIARLKTPVANALTVSSTLMAYAIAKMNPLRL